MYKFFKGLMDFLLSLIGGILLIPFMIIIAIIIKCSSKGPVLFKQERVGKNKKLFKIWKFRTMRIDTIWQDVNNWSKTCALESN